jgi:hypothetical protein
MGVLCMAQNRVGIPPIPCCWFLRKTTKAGDRPSSSATPLTNGGEFVQRLGEPLMRFQPLTFVKLSASAVVWHNMSKLMPPCAKFFPTVRIKSSSALVTRSKLSRIIIGGLFLSVCSHNGATTIRLARHSGSTFGSSFNDLARKEA